jgi:SHS2 domain-containing protein
MPFRYLEDLTVADVAFEARGATLDELFRAAWAATLQVMIEDPNALIPIETRTIAIQEPDLDLLLHNFLQELIFYKDAEGLLLRIEECRVHWQEDRGLGRGKPARLEAQAGGQAIDPKVHRLGTDVKAVTFFRFELNRDGEGWKTTVVLDV